MKVSEVMTRDVLALSPDQTLEEAAKLLVERGVSGAPVVKDGVVVGMLSERDLLDTQTDPRPPRYLELLGGIIYFDDVGEFKRQLARTVATKVEQVMTKDVAVVKADSPLEDAAKIILDRRVNRVPVVEDGQLVGIVTRSDVLRGTMGQ
jgi:CBS domain-containing protein